MTVRLLDGIGDVKGDFKSRKVEVIYDPSQVSVKAVQQALNNIGYESEVIAE